MAANKKTKSKHPAHKARKIVCIGDGAFFGWSIYPEQLPAMKRVVLRAIDRAAKRRLQWGSAWREALADDCLRSIGLDAKKISDPPTPKSTILHEGLRSGGRRS